MYYVVGRLPNADSLVLSTHLRRTPAERQAAAFREHLEGYAAIEVERAGNINAYYLARAAGTLQVCPRCLRHVYQLHACRRCSDEVCFRCASGKKCCGPS